MFRLIRHPMFPFPAVTLLVISAVAILTLVDLYRRPPPPDFQAGQFARVDINGWPILVTRVYYDGILGENTGWQVDCVLLEGLRLVRTFQPEQLRASHGPQDRRRRPAAGRVGLDE